MGQIRKFSLILFLISLNSCVSTLEVVSEYSNRDTDYLIIKVLNPKYYHREVVYFSSAIKLKNISNSEFILDLKSVKVFYNNVEVKELSIRYFNEWRGSLFDDFFKVADYYVYKKYPYKEDLNYRYLKFKKNEKKEVQLGFSIDLKSRNNKFGSIDTLSIVFEVDNRMGDIERIQNRFTFK